MFLGKKISLCAGVLLSIGYSISPLRADVVQIVSPTQSYLSGTARIDFDPLSFPVASQITDGSETLMYDSPLLVGQVPEFWASWNNPPAVETSTPIVGWTEGRSELLIQLSSPMATFGFELEPDQYDAQLVSAFFFTAGGSIYQIDRSPSGDSGALLYAASITDDPIAGVYIEDYNGGAFAIADQRYSSSFIGEAPEPRSVALFIVGMIALVSIRLKMTSKIAAD